ncbi:vomeronasal type-1 receptor 90-like [Erinaceus europaeus]|uniref:Vomeronasal type-1 receptor n=1 Tax=Erinaceus europaeus TaxID=9365 RepID=A0A1S2ZCC9_ERIEU|nr:vomeronasal type-1 receptor 90-like [Erinaceus europaeus]
MNESNRFPATVAIQNALFFIVGVGVSVNTMLLFHILIFLIQHRPRTTDLTIFHLAFLHIVMLITVGFTVANIMRSSHSWNDLSCKAVVFLNRLMRGLSICTTCLLSILQAITLSPRSSCLAKFRHNSSQHSLYCLIFLWVFNTSISARFLLSAVANFNGTSTHLLFVTDLCSLWPQNYSLLFIFTTLTALQDVIFIGLMALSSGYMVTLLCRHRRLSQHLKSTNLSQKTSPEKRATQTILLLMSFFVVMYFTDCIINSLRTVWTKDPALLYVQILLSNGYATISPLVLISTEKQVTMLRKNASLRVSKFCGF